MFAFPAIHFQKMYRFSNDDSHHRRLIFQLNSWVDPQIDLVFDFKIKHLTIIVLFRQLPAAYSSKVP